MTQSVNMVILLMPNRLGKYKYDTEWLRNEYVNKLRSAVDIAKDLGVTSGTIYDAMKRRGIQRRSTSEAAIRYPEIHNKVLLEKEYKTHTIFELSIKYGASEEAIRKLLIKYGILSRPIAPRKTSENSRKRYDKPGRNRPGYHRWKIEVVKRDKKCFVCGAKEFLTAHHIKPYKDNVELRLDINNGVTLCRKCHSMVHDGRLQKQKSDETENILLGQLRTKLHEHKVV